MVGRAGEWTLTEAARLLGQPQHRLIYLCEKGVIEPDLQDAEGRGSSRRFSSRNLLEFAVALSLRDLAAPVSLVAAVIHVLRVFEQLVGKRIPGFRLPESLQEPRAPDLRIIVSDDQHLYFTLALGESAPKVFGGLGLRDLSVPVRSTAAIKRTLSSARPAAKSASLGDFGGPEGSKHARLEVSVSAVARDLRVDA